ncbi:MULTISPECIES: hypothetical protein [unclassified Lentimonas]|uniref:hypothetical protein n=1 Tax=unclassified Lentimonas TaxID=2630993 RepID=UPI00132B7CCF|nr:MULTISPECIES: hypothetical protein [unclassified Lentimonas]CAA6692712.1 Unannotated [Lentimonas sp. CC10]CAA6696722.1 Unannotated [Lentimonas sp. CC19]CAA7072298.1 Unannotated [Lentimonas sp. CC11]
MNKLLLANTALFLFGVSLNAAELFNDGFESGASGFTYVDNGTSNTGAYSITTPGADGTGGAGHVGDNLVQYASNTIAAGYIKANGAVANGAQDFSLTFDFKFEQESTYDDAMIFVGDLSNGNYYRIGLGENSGTQQVYQISGGVRDANTTTTYSASTFTDDTWYSATINWASGTNTLSFDSVLFGDMSSVVSFSTILDGSGLNNASIASLAASGVEFGFGTFNDQASFDNVIINGVAIPESSTCALLAGMLALGAAVCRRRA